MLGNPYHISETQKFFYFTNEDAGTPAGSRTQIFGSGDQCSIH